MSGPKRRSGSAWPAWKLRAYLPQGWRRWDVLRVVELAKPDPAAGCWQLQTKLGSSANVGLFADRTSAVKWAKARCDRVEEAHLAEAVP